MVYTASTRSSDNPLLSSVTAAKTTDSDTHGELELPDGTWDLVFKNNGEQASVMITGRVTAALDIPHGAHEDITIVTFKPHVFLRGLSSEWLVDKAMLLPVHGNYFTLGSSQFEIPSSDNVELLLARFEKQNAIDTDKFVEAVLSNRAPAASLRTLQRHFKKTTGLFPHHFFQIQRAQYAEELIKNGHALGDVANNLGYADQSHMTRELRRFRGQTPAKITVD